MAGIDGLTTGAKSAGIMVLVVAVVLAILETFQTGGTLTVDGSAYNAVGSGITAIDDFITWLAIVILVIVGSFLLKKVSSSF
jgi:hypothetical protein